jgi:ribosomal protein S18 acetylase RimI-like enzyme
VPAEWIEHLQAALGDAPAFAGYSLRPAARNDETMLYDLHREAMRDYVDATWGWDEAWQRAHFSRTYAAARNAVIVRTGASPRDAGRVSLTRHWRKIFLRDVELVAAERNRGIGGAVVAAIIDMARADNRYVELYVLDRNPAQRLYARLGFRVIAEDGARRKMRVD